MESSTMFKKVSAKGVLIGSAVAVVSANILVAIPVLYLLSRYPLSTLPVADQVDRVNALLWHDPVAMVLGWTTGSLCSVLGGYIAAKIAKHNELLNGILASFLVVVSILLFINNVPPFWIIPELVAGPIFSLLGGYLRLRKKNSLAQ